MTHRLVVESLSDVFFSPRRNFMFSILGISVLCFFVVVFLWL